MITYNKANINGGLDEGNTEVYGQNVNVNTSCTLIHRRKEQASIEEEDKAVICLRLSKNHDLL